MSDLSDPSYWRHHAARGRWSKIDSEDPRSVPPEDYDELRGVLEAIVPKRMLRDGLEEAEVPLTWREIEGSVEDPQARHELKWAPRNLEVLTSMIELRDEEAEGPSSASLDDAVARAVDLLREHGIHYEGWNETFLFPDPKTGNLRWIRGVWGAALQARFDLLPTREKRAWRAKYPWRSCKPLSDWWSWEDVFRELTYSPVWHALRILCLQDELQLRPMDALLTRRRRLASKLANRIKQSTKRPRNTMLSRSANGMEKPGKRAPWPV